MPLCVDTAFHAVLLHQHKHGNPSGRCRCRRPASISSLLPLSQTQLKNTLFTTSTSLQLQACSLLATDARRKAKTIRAEGVASRCTSPSSGAQPFTTATSPQSQAHPCRLRKGVSPGHKGAPVLAQDGRQNGGLHHVRTPPSPAADILPRPQRGAVQRDGALLHCACRGCMGTSYVKLTSGLLGAPQNSSQHKLLFTASTADARVVASPAAAN